MRNSFFKFDKHEVNITGRGDQTQLNWEIPNTDNVILIPYSFQGLWISKWIINYENFNFII